MVVWQAWAVARGRGSEDYGLDWVVVGVQVGKGGCSDSKKSCQGVDGKVEVDYGSIHASVERWKQVSKGESSEQAEFTQISVRSWTIFRSCGENLKQRHTDPSGSISLVCPTAHLQHVPRYHTTCPG